MANGLGIFIKAFTIVLIVAPMLIGLTYEYGTPQAAQQVNSSVGEAGSQYNTYIYNPLNQSIHQGINSSANLQQSDLSIGFALAFILPGFISIVNTGFQIPVLLSTYISTLIGFLPNGGLSLGYMAGYIIDDMLLFVVLWGLSLWMKMPAW